MNTILGQGKYSDADLLYIGSSACPGCGSAIGLRQILKALENKVMMIIVGSCSTGYTGSFPYTVFKIPALHSPMAGGPGIGSGLKVALERKGNADVTVLVWAGDGASCDIGLAALSGAAERNEDILYVCYDNEAYMNTGGQRSSATPWGAVTQSTPKENFESRFKKDITEIMASHRIPYAANATVAYPEDLIRKIKKAKTIRGTKFIHLLAPCVTGWRYSSQYTIQLSRLAVDCKVFPIYEVEDGVRYTINIFPKETGIREYLRLQERFKHLNEEQIEFMQKHLDEEWRILRKKIEYSYSLSG